MTSKQLLLLTCAISPLCFAEADGAPKIAPAAVKDKPAAVKDKPAATKDKPAEAEDESTLYLESTLVGDKEQPTVSYFIPWKGTGTPDNLHWNIEQKNDKTLELIDRDIMVRSMSIYNELDMENPAPLE